MNFTDLLYFQTNDLLAGDLQVSVWLAKPDCFIEKFQKAAISLKNMEITDDSPVFGATTSALFESEYVKLGSFCVQDNPSRHKLLETAYTIANEWVGEATHNELLGVARAHGLASKTDTDSIYRTLSCQAGDILEVNGRFWVVLGLGFAQLNILS